MEINIKKLKYSLKLLSECLLIKDKFIEKKLRLNEYNAFEVEGIYNYLGLKILDPVYTAHIGSIFQESLLLILTSVIKTEDNTDDYELYQRKCIALSTLIKYSNDVLRLTGNYLKNKPPPFCENIEDVIPKKKCKLDNVSNSSDFSIVKCCYNLLSTDPSFYKDAWDWSPFVVHYLNKGCFLQQLYYNNALAIITSMGPHQLMILNANIPESVIIQFDNELRSGLKHSLVTREDINESSIAIKLNFSSKIVTNVEGVFLPIFNYENYKFFESTDGKYDRIVKVDSTKINLRSISLGISSGKAVCLTGSVGCGKTTLVEYLARKTGRIFPNHLNLGNYEKSEHYINEYNNKKNNDKSLPKRGNEEFIEEVDDESVISKNGFLRIQLGDQTDSKMLLGQYRCTDVPGEFIWLPGVLTQAVMNGYWLILEDLDCATQDTFAILSSLLENNYLSVPGFRDCVKINAGFQLFVTVRTNKIGNNSKKSLFSLLEKYLYTVNILPLSRNELCNVIAINYPKLKTVANRIVEVFLTFSSGDHTAADNLRNQETEDKTNTMEKYIALPFERSSMFDVPNSGRLVSTRDLMKLCQRSNPMFSVSSTECAYFVFQNAIDVFCSYLPQGPQKTHLITSIGAKLGIIQSRCEFFSNEFKPDIDNDFNRIKVGRAELFVRQILSDIEDESQPAKKIKLSVLQEKNILLQNNKFSNTFSFTRMSSCLLERIAVCVSQNEPVLLVGETGVGKTSSVQYLADKTRHKLVVVNMNNQSDASDLVGGYKPVDLSFVIAPLRSEFERLFRKTFNQTKNENFLKKISISYNAGLYDLLLNAMLMVVETVFNRVKENTLKDKADIPKWKNLQTKLTKLNAQLTKSINISFAFIPGSLVNCIQNGDWVLLDEINLSSAETLECLSTILEPDGSIVLLEKGDFTPVKRHPDFRIFACMNPNTDIGKKDLPVGIRNRFTEFYVDELTTDSDLMLLVSDYLKNTGIEKRRVSNIVKLYKKLKSLAELQLNDGLGNRPVFSLRTLCRSLRICAKNLCGSIERNLYESFCLSFLTQLDPMSHSQVLGLIKEVMLSNEKAILSQGIPKPGVDFLNFEGYWIQKGPIAVQDCKDYILTDSVKENLKDLARIISIGKLPILLQGPTSAGKTSLIEYVAKRSGNHCLRINNHEHTDLQEYIGTYITDDSGKLLFKEGILVEAMRNGYWIILDELNLAPTDILEALNRVLDDNRELFIPETQTLVKAHSNFMLFATQNPPGLYGGRKTLSRAFKNRFIELHFSEIPRNELETILEKRCHIPQSYAKKMVKCMWELQVNRKSTTTKNVFTLRDLFRWGNRYTFADKNLLQNNTYDWNQHLIEEGYLVLSAKVRTAIEIEVIEETLYKNFRKKISLNNLFEAHDQTSLVTKDIIECINKFNKRTDIVWTLNMTRMAVLTAKALQFNEPVLLVGPTGCGKTTVCQILASIKETTLRILNCHMHTEGSDFLGGLRPCRQSEENCDNSQTGRKLFEWSDGPLVISMQEGNYFMADEISLAEDSVLERLNCVLEPERTVLLAEKGGTSTTDTNPDNLSKKFVIKAQEGFQFLATMNPGGDFGKKELSPALRNRFTEIWCIPSETKADLIRIAENCIRSEYKDMSKLDPKVISTFLVNVIFFIREEFDKFKFSIRDILAWANFLLQNKTSNFAATCIFGLETLFLDSLEMLPHESYEKLEIIKENVIDFAINQIQNVIKDKFSRQMLESMRGTKVERHSHCFGIMPFYVPTNNAYNVDNNDFLFDAPTTKKNLFRILAALSLQKAILLEGPPGVGKTSIVESLANAVGFKVVRINLCEHTDLADLFGTDLPAEDNVLDDEKAKTKSGSFLWRDGPLLSALKSENTWILLDELNLAPQSVLEGLNAILDHRGEVYIPELNKTFFLGKKTRIFGAQNPLRQGGGRKGLPQSFLNRFTKVYLRKLSTADLLFVVNGKYAKYFESLHSYFNQYARNLKSTTNSSYISLFDIFDMKDTLQETKQENMTHTIDLQFNLAERMVRFSEILDNGLSQLKFGFRGGPFEINLRDILRWCDLMINPNTGFVLSEQLYNLANLQKVYMQFLQTLFERMKLVYYQRMRSDEDKKYILETFSAVFKCCASKLNEKSEDILLYWNDSKIYLNDICLNRNSESSYASQLHLKNNRSGLLLTSQRELLKNLMECVHMNKPVLLCGPTDCGKTKIIDILCTVSNKLCNSDTIDDSVTGSFQQIDLNRHLDEVSQNVEALFTFHLRHFIINCANATSKTFLGELIKKWNKYKRLSIHNGAVPNVMTMLDESIIFKTRIQQLNNIIEEILTIAILPEIELQLRHDRSTLDALKKIVQKSQSLNTGGSFEWVDSKIVKSLKTGQFICLEHVNLCSLAVLDRLNSVFEPNGNLLISEKGVSLDSVAETVRKHDNFRAFLTVDPKNGELSRAMRNRCVEISIDKDNYTDDDLKLIVHENGIASAELICIILKMHKSICAVTDIHSYNISHLTQFAFLVSSYQRIGHSDRKAVYNSAMEVYVYSSNIDLLGFGLEFYQNKLREIVVEISENVCSSDTYDIKNIIIRSNNMNSLTMIKLQMQPLEILINNFSNTDLCRKTLTNLFDEFKTIQFENNAQFTSILLYMMYECSSFSDVTLRYCYIKSFLSKELNIPDSLKKKLVNLNELLNDTVQNSNVMFKESIKELPWNNMLLPRIRDYSKRDIDQPILALSALLISNVLIEDLCSQKVNKMHEISALAYSEALKSNLITDIAKNVLLKNLYNFLKGMKIAIQTALKKSTLNLEKYTNSLISFLWANRILEVAKENLFVDQTINRDLLDKLLLHIKWVDKNLLHLLEELDPSLKQLYPEFEESSKNIIDYMASVKHPLNLMQKIYCKEMSYFDPYYTTDQLKLHFLEKQYDEMVKLVPQFGSYSSFQITQKICACESGDSKKIKSFILSGNSQALKYTPQISLESLDLSEVPVSLSTSLKIFIETTKKQEEPIVSNIDYSVLETNIENFKLYFKDDEESFKQTADLINVELIPLKEFFVYKALCNMFSCNTFNINEFYYESIPSLTITTHELLNISTSNSFSAFKTVWSDLLNYIMTCDNDKDFAEIFSKFGSDYKKISTCARMVHMEIQKYQMNNLAIRNDVFWSERKDNEINSEQVCQGPPLTTIISKLLFEKDGTLRIIALKDLAQWRNSLENIRQLLWNNSSLITEQYDHLKRNFESSLSLSKKLTQEVQYVKHKSELSGNNQFTDYNENFQNLVNKLITVTTFAESISSLNHKSLEKTQTLYWSSLINTLIGSIELCLLTFTPLIDPVEKNRLKLKYISEDIDCLTALAKTYDFMKIVMHYKDFGNDICCELENNMLELVKKKNKCSEKVALRPSSCQYSSLAQDIKHFLNSNCDPKSMLNLINLIEEYWKESIKFKPTNSESLILKMTELCKRIELWIANSQKFMYHTLGKYNGYYNDFVKPMECSIVTTRFGLEGLKACTEQIKNSIVLNSENIFVNINDGGKLVKVLQNVIQFPSVNPLNVFDLSHSNDIFNNRSSNLSVIDKIAGSEYLYFHLLKSKISEIKNFIAIDMAINETMFNDLDYALNICNQIWQEEEERRKIKKAEEESLYISKTKCVSEDEDVVEMREILENFPTYVHEDFGEFIEEESLEKVVKIFGDDVKTSTKNRNIVSDKDFIFLAENFVYIMTNFSKLYYHNPNIERCSQIDFIHPFKDRLQVFVQLYNKYKPALNEWIDEIAYNSLTYAVGLQQEMLKDVPINNNSKSYNFYKDANIPEIITCIETLRKIELNASDQLILYPEHATLIDILRVIDRIRSLPSTSPVARFNAGFQILRQKVAQWNEVAHKNNHMKDLEMELAEYVTKWTKLELQFWKNCLSQTSEKVEVKAYKYWFFIYNLFHEYLEENELDDSYIDIRETEKRFEHGDSPENKKTIKIDRHQIISILRQFVEASTYGDFHNRMQLLKAFEFYLHHISTSDENKKHFLIATLRNIQIYFKQFALEIETTKISMRAPIEKKLKEFVKIESYNKDLSYFSMKSNVARVHRNLNKFLKEYESHLTTKITPVFQPKDATVKDYNFENDKGKNLRNESKVKHYMIDVKNFIAPLKLKDKFHLTSQISEECALLNKIHKLFLTSRNVVRDTLSKSKFPSLIYSLDLLLSDQIESCDYLRNLEVDRSIEKSKQKLQAKQILRQKRKALSDLFKTLGNLGLSYKSGLLELSLETVFEDYTLNPFCIKSMLSKGKKIDQNLIALGENLDTYYAKCVFKLKLLQNIMLTPLSELGPPNIDRIKGFAVDMFLLVQNQRRLFSESIKCLYDLRISINNMKSLSELLDGEDFIIDNFKTNIERRETLKASFAKVRLVFEQFVLFLKYVPEKCNKDLCVYDNDIPSISVNQEIYGHINERCHYILETAKNAIKNLSNMETDFINYTELLKNEKIRINLITEIENVCLNFKSANGQFISACEPLLETIEFIKENEFSQIHNHEDDSMSTENIDIELENIVHLILLSKQKLLKKNSAADNNDISEDNNSLQDNHLKAKVSLELAEDWKILNMPNIVNRISIILLTIKHTENAFKIKNSIRKLVSILPILEQFELVGDYYILQQLGAHKVSVKMLSIMMTVFIELSSKGFCVPQDLMQDEEGQSNENDQQKGEGFGLEDGTGENDASDKIESEDQLDDAKRPEDRDKEEKTDENCKEEKGIDMSDDFDGQMQDIDKSEDDDENDRSDNEDDLDKEMGDTEQGAEKLDDQIWGSDEEEEPPQNEEMKEEENGKGSNEEDDNHNNMDSKNKAEEGKQDNDEQDGLDATNETGQQDKKQQEKDIDSMHEPEVDEEQVNACHNELEEPPEPEDIDLGDMNVEDENDHDGHKNEENPFDIDKMKENMEIDEECNLDNDSEEKAENEENEETGGSDSEPEPEIHTNKDEENKDDETKDDRENEVNDEEENDTQTRGEVTEEEKDNNNEKNKEEKSEDYAQSLDKASKEENVQSVPEIENKGSNDEIKQSEEDKNVEQEQKMDAQDTGEEKDGIGQSENDTSEKGHQGIADTKETSINEDKKNEKNTREKRKQGQTDEERTLGEAEKNKTKELKTIDKLKEPKHTEMEENLDDNDIEADEHQHVKDAKQNDKTTLDNATEEQSKKMQHINDEEDDMNKDAESEENIEELMDVDEKSSNEDSLEEVSQLKSEKVEDKSDTPSKSDKSKDKCEATDTIEVDGNVVDTMTVSRSKETTAHYIKEIILDASLSEELTTAETLQFRQMFQSELISGKKAIPMHDDFETWQLITHKMLPSARELCEQLRLILEPTKCTRLKGDYRTGRRINMKKIIPYIASQFRKDKIWLRRTKPAQRDYNITIAIDDSKSMHHNNSKILTLQAICLVSQALTLLESGKLSILSFGECPKIILNPTDQFDGPKLVNSLNFAQDKTNIAELLHFIRTGNSEAGLSSSDNAYFENLVLVLSDGRNIYSEGRSKVRDAIKLARLQRIFLVYIIIDNPENKNSILDIQTMEVLPDKKISIKSYLDDFPFPYYIIVRDLAQLPTVLSEAMRQWFELVNSG